MSAASGTGDPVACHRRLLIRPGAIGDVILSLPALEAARADLGHEILFYQYLQWIAEERLVKFRPIVVRMLNDANLSTDLFLATLAALEMLDDQSLWRVMGETVPAQLQHELSTLLERQQSASLTATERERLMTLQQQADLVMLRKARAAVLLRFRGKRIPTPTELGQLASRPA